MKSKTANQKRKMVRFSEGEFSSWRHTSLEMNRRGEGGEFTPIKPPISFITRTHSQIYAISINSGLFAYY